MNETKILLKMTNRKNGQKMQRNCFYLFSACRICSWASSIFLFMLDMTKICKNFFNLNHFSLYFFFLLLIQNKISRVFAFSYWFCAFENEIYWMKYKTFTALFYFSHTKVVETILFSLFVFKSKKKTVNFFYFVVSDFIHKIFFFSGNLSLLLLMRWQILRMQYSTFRTQNSKFSLYEWNWLYLLPTKDTGWMTKGVANITVCAESVNFSVF